MSTQHVTVWHHSNKYNAEAACEHCHGVVRHEPWCVSCSEIVLYAHQAVLNADVLTEGDKLILHALGVEWSNNRCACQSAESKPN